MNQRTPSHRATRAFTLIELLVVVAIIAILIGILLPALSKARQSAWQLTGASTQRQLMTAVLTYASSNEDWIPGLNTSGKNVWTNNEGSEPPEAVIRWMETNSAAPVQPGDWMSPALAGEDLPADREARFEALLNRFADPAMTERPVVRGSPEAGGGIPPGNQQMIEYLAERSPQNPVGISYLMPAYFQTAGDSAPAEFVKASSIRSGGAETALRVTHRLPAGYVPRMDRIGAVSKKVGIASGFRFFTGGNIPTTDFTYSPHNWGSFLERTPVDARSLAWGFGNRVSGSGEPSPSMLYSYRHAGRMNAAFFDGHVEALADIPSRDPALWAPSGSTFLGLVPTDAASYNFGYDAAQFVQNGRSTIP